MVATHRSHMVKDKVTDKITDRLRVTDHLKVTEALSSSMVHLSKAGDHHRPVNGAAALLPALPVATRDRVTAKDLRLHKEATRLTDSNNTARAVTAVAVAMEDTRHGAHAMGSVGAVSASPLSPRIRITFPV